MPTTLRSITWPGLRMEAGEMHGAGRVGIAELVGGQVPFPAEYMAMQQPSGSAPFLASQALRSSGVTWASALPSACAAMLTMASGTTSFSTGDGGGILAVLGEMERRIQVGAGVLVEMPLVEVVSRPFRICRHSRFRGRARRNRWGSRGRACG